MDFNKTIYIKKDEYLDGRAVVIFDCDTPFVLTNNNYSNIIIHIINTFRLSIDLSKTQQGIEEFCVLVNLRNIKKCKLSIKFILHMIHLLKKLFPDNLYKCLFENSSLFFRSIYLLIRHAIDKETRKKISIIKNGRQVMYDDTLV